MRARAAVLTSLVATLAFVAAPVVADAAPHHNRGVTIHATPNPLLTGEAVLIYGRLEGSTAAGQLITLYHHIPPTRGYTVIGTTTTVAGGYYEFTRAEDVVTTNRDWYVTAPGGHHSRTVHEKVFATVSIAASSTTGDTNHKILFTGNVAPNHAGERVILQSTEDPTTDTWRNIGDVKLGPASNYAIRHRFLRPGARDVRVVFPGDRRNIASVSTPVSVVISQTQKPDFTIKSSAPIIPDGDSATVSGTLYQSGSSTSPDGGATVILWGHRQTGGPYAVLAQTTTSSTGAYTFTVTPSNNEVYQARTPASSPPVRTSAQLFEGVRDVVSITASSPTSTVGGSVTFSGTVTPDKAGHLIYLQRLDPDGSYDTVAVGVVGPSSGYRFTWRFGSPGTKTFRTLVEGGPDNLAGASPTATIEVTLPPVTLLPTTT